MTNASSDNLKQTVADRVMNKFADNDKTLSKCADEVNLVFPRCQRNPLSLETSERFLLVDGSGKRVVQGLITWRISKFQPG